MPLENFVKKGSKRETIYFYRADREYGFLSNCFKSKIIFEVLFIIKKEEFTELITFDSAEHAYQWEKFANKDDARIMLQLKPHLAAILGHGLFGFDITLDWTKKKVKRMEEVLEAKFTSHPNLAKELIATGNAELIEKSSTDSFWGNGKNGNGKNMLGKLLMELRSKLREYQFGGI